MNILLALAVLFGIATAAVIFCVLISALVERCDCSASEFIRTHFG